MKKLALSLLVAFGGFSSAAIADNDYGVEVGIRQQSGDVDSTTDDGKAKMGYQFGVTGHFPISGPWHLRSGMLFTQRPLSVDTASGDYDVTMSYLDVPVALMYKFEEYAGVFAGVSLGLHLNSDSDVGSIKDEKSPLIPILLGANFKFAPQLGVAVYYESASGEVAQGLKNYRAVGANLMITFD